MAQVLEQIYRQGVIAGQAMPLPKPQEIILRTLSTKKEQTIQAPFPFLEIDNIHRSSVSYCRDIAADFSPADRLLVCELVQHLVVPNISYNLAETLDRQQKALNVVHPVFFTVHAGELILQEGERVTPLHLAKLKAQDAAYTGVRRVMVFLGTFFCLALTLWMVYNLARISLKSFSTRLKDLAFLGTLIIIGLLANCGLVNLAAIVSPFKPLLGRNLIYAIPIGLGPIYAALFLGMETGLAMTFLVATLTALLLPKPFPLFLFLVTAGLMGVWGVRSFQKRRSLINTGLAVCGVNLLMVTALKLLEYPVNPKTSSWGRPLPSAAASLPAFWPWGSPRHRNRVPLHLQHPPPGTPEPGPAPLKGTHAGGPGPTTIPSWWGRSSRPRPRPSAPTPCWPRRRLITTMSAR